MQFNGPSAAGFMYSDTGGDWAGGGLPARGADQRQPVGPRSSTGCAIATAASCLSFPSEPIARRCQMTQILDLASLAKMIAGFLVELDLRDVTLVCNDWGGAQLVIAPGGSDRVGGLVLVSCEAFDNYPPGIPGRLLCLNASLPGGTFLTAQLLRPRLIRYLPFTCGALTKKRMSNEQFMALIEPLRRNPRVRRDLDKYLRSVPAKQRLLEWAEQQRVIHRSRPRRVGPRGEADASRARGASR